MSLAKSVAEADLSGFGNIGESQCGSEHGELHQCYSATTSFRWFQDHGKH